VNGGDPPNLPANNESNPVAGFWRRVLGVFVDSLILGAVGVLLGFLFFGVFAQMGSWGRAVGFTIALFYFGFMNSGIFGGQTLGKRAAKTKVVNGNGGPLALGRSFLRYVALGVPFFLNNSHLSPQFLMSWYVTLFSVLVLGLGGSIIYLIIFNRRTRQSLHDLIVGSYVVKSDAPASPITIKMWKGHWVVVTLILLASVVVPNVLFAEIGNNDFFKPLLVLQQKIMEEPEVSYAGVTEGQNWSSSATGTKKTTDLDIAAFLKRRVPSEEKLANKLAEIAFTNDPRASQKDVISITLVYGYDIGIASGWQRQPYNFSPQQWQERLGAANK
jgi:uncharacterized RDD family membrane protein YckC